MRNQKGYNPEQLHVSRQEVARGVICEMLGAWHARPCNDLGKNQREVRPGEVAIQDYWGAWAG